MADVTVRDPLAGLVLVGRCSRYDVLVEPGDLPEARRQLER
jgi:hypothetical protein